MIDAICTYGKSRTVYSILVFQNLPEADIDKLRQSLLCPECGEPAYYRRASIDGKAACFGSRYHREGCTEYRSSPQRESELKDSTEVSKILLETKEILFDFSGSSSQQSKATIIPKVSKGTKSNLNIQKISTSNESSSRKAKINFSKALSSLLRGSNLAESSVLIEIDAGYKFKAKNLFVNFSDAVATVAAKDAKPKMYWGTISHSDSKIEWLNPADCVDVGISIKRYRKDITERFNVRDRRDLEGAGIILFGKCFWNSKKNRKIIELWNLDRVYISKLNN
ncbi:hypothetical protein L9G15_11910 [Shewanella sp. A3A]|nr:hypothetical protein [Shewanella ferrihydritica]